MKRIIRLVAICIFAALPANGQLADAVLGERFAGAKASLDKSALSIRLGELDRISSPEDIPDVIDVLQGVTISPEERLVLDPKYPVFKSEPLTERERAAEGHIILKFVDGARVRALNPFDLSLDAQDIATLRQRLRTLTPDSDSIDAADRAMLEEHGLDRRTLASEMERVRRMIGRADIVGWQPLFSQDIDTLDTLRANTERKSGRRASDLGNYYWIQMAEGADAGALLRNLNELAVVEQAYLDMQTIPADIPPTTGSYSNGQGYLNPAPAGIGARAVLGESGALGNNVHIIDIESGWNIAHEDLPAVAPLPTFFDDEWEHHGTATLGVLVAPIDGAGVDGIVPNATAGLVTHYRRTGFGTFVSNADSIIEAALQLSVGDVLLLEVQSLGPKRADCTCETDDGSPRNQCGMVPVEYADHVYDAIVATSNTGVIVVEPSANGEADLDDPLYKGKFDRLQRESGALMVGASRSNARTRMCFSNHGDRVDVHAWGEDVITTGYGKSTATCAALSCLTAAQARVNGNDKNQWYTDAFGGTSSASAIVAGAAASVQGVLLARNTFTLNWLEMRSLLSSTGTPPAAGDDIGPMPDLGAAIAELPGGTTGPAPGRPNAEYETTISLGRPIVEADTVAGLETGDPNQRIRVGGGGDDEFAISRITFGERGDRPCFIRTDKASIIADTYGSEDEIDLCGSKGPTDRSITWTPYGVASTESFIHQVQVCNSSNVNHPFRLKGIKAWMRTVEPDGRISDLAGISETARANCDGNWREPSSCPIGHVAVRLEVHWRADSSDLSMSGIRLICRPVLVEQTCISNCLGQVEAGEFIDVDGTAAGTLPGRH